MRYELMDYQRAAAADVSRLLGRGRHDWTSHGARSSFALSAITGAGKTVIAAAVVEAAFFGSADLDADPDPTATFLWITDDPALNRQTRHKMMASSELLSPKQLVVLDDNYLNHALEPGHVYFINTQKLSKGALLNQAGTNLRQSSFWDILGNTIRSESTTLYLILDEAHRGMKSPRDRQTIVQRIINGEHGSNPPAPVVWGISATIDRFTEAMGRVVDRTEYPHVVVDIAKVRASGLVKDEIGLDQPEEKGTFSTTLLRDAVRSVKDYETRWAAYTTAAKIDPVLPILVVQVPDKADQAKLTEVVSTIESEWPGLGPGAVAHVFGEHEPIVLGARTISWERPEAIQFDDDIRVVLAKEAISTGWDCPRAEVLYSERPAKDATHIAQIIGRMVRQPLAERISTDDVLNSVACYLPLFDRGALTTIRDVLSGKGVHEGSTVGPTVLVAPEVFDRSPHIDADVFDFVGKLPSLPTPDTLANPLRRARRLAMLLVDDESGTALLPGAGEHLTSALNSKLDGLAAEHAAKVDAQIANLLSADLVSTRVTSEGSEIGTVSRSVATHARDLDSDIRKVIKSVKEGAAEDYYEYRARKAARGTDWVDIRVAVAALFLVEGVVEELEAVATRWAQTQLDVFKVDIANTTGPVRERYRKVQEQTSTPEAVTISLRNNEKVATRNSSGDPLPTFTKHLFAGQADKFPVGLNDWETTVVKTEVKRRSTVAWYRNPARATPSALRIAYLDETGTWASLQVDFVVISRKTDGTLGASIVDPHGDHLADAKAKLLALADYAERFDGQFVRIESLAKTKSGELRTLNLLDPAIREAVRAYDGGKVSVLYELHGQAYL